MKRILLLMVGAAFLLSVSSAFGQNVPMYFNGTYDGGTALGAGAGYYEGSINGVNVGSGYSSPGMICDDYYDHIDGGENWKATGYSVSSLNAGNIAADSLFGGAAHWGDLNGLTAIQGYEALAYVVSDMFANSGHQNDDSQVLWYLTSNANAHAGAPGIVLSALSAGAQALVATVENTSNLKDLSTYTGLWLYTQPFAPPGVQEMWGQIPVPEGGAALMYLLLAGVTCFGAMFYSRRRAALGGLA